MLSVTIIGVHDDIDNMTMAISNNILSLISGDYDGDVLNFVIQLDNKTKVKFEVLNPKRFTISSNNGRFDRKMELIKEQPIGIHLMMNSY